MSVRHQLTQKRDRWDRGWNQGRGSKRFFYGICLIASGFIALFHWPPVPVVFATISRLCGRLGSPEWFASVIMLTLSVFPLLLGLVLLITWFFRKAMGGRGAA